MGSEPVDGGVDPGWFEFYDDTITIDPSTPADRDFLSGLRAGAVSHRWPCEPYDTWAYHAIDDDQHLLRVGVWVDDDEKQRRLLTCGVEFDGTHIVGGECYHDIPFDFEGAPEKEIVYSGPVQILVQRAGEYFERVLSRPIELREWFENGEEVYREWALAHTERALTAQLKPKPDRPADRVTLVRGVRELEAGSGGGRKRWWDFGKRRRSS
ncbi:hypothetical protein [Amycolatopsis sp. FDAARGOS 1241]|uniref:hypothetical protein n=1 Tax=Amycolatopsis sp. FDAARGOS 1241 TaxID=2778070 RepID=UPI00195020CD|nr:hypothetical protein [Amycolatopsis sp. FDAARGOS 1241]QRP42805.1 hypothetical protein I6J71_25395 [Amycolatopsis sp. FDAARGOS 1241]